jgi:hypothetical protein
MKQIRQIGGRKGAQHAGYRKVLHGFARIEVTDAAVRPGSSNTRTSNKQGTPSVSYE